MPHTSVLVLMNNFPAKHELQRALQPWHKFEHTGFDDKYVKNIDVTDEYRQSFENNPDARFLDYLVAEHGLNVLNAPSDVIGDRHKYGYILLHERSNHVKAVIKRTNPNAKWSGWRIGGRFAGRLISRNVHMAIRGESDVSMYHGAIGCCDIAKITDLHLDRMRERNMKSEQFSNHLPALDVDVVVQANTWIDKEHATDNWHAIITHWLRSEYAWAAVIDCYLRDDECVQTLASAVNS